MTEREALVLFSNLVAHHQAAEFVERCVFGDDGYTRTPDGRIVFIPAAEITGALADLRDAASAAAEITFGTCDWGYCDNPAIDTRYSDDHGMLLPVCAEHIEDTP